MMSLNGAIVTWNYLLWIFKFRVFDTAMCAPHPNLLPTAKLQARMNVECGEKGLQFASLTQFQ